MREEVDDAHGCQVFFCFVQLTDVKVIDLSIEFTETQKKEKLDHYFVNLPGFSADIGYFKVA